MIVVFLLHYIDVDHKYHYVLSCIAECGSSSSVLTVEMVRFVSVGCQCDGVSRPLTELGKGGGFMAVGYTPSHTGTLLKTPDHLHS